MTDPDKPKFPLFETFIDKGPITYIAKVWTQENGDILEISVHRLNEDGTEQPPLDQDSHFHDVIRERYVDYLENESFYNDDNTT